MNLDPLQRAFLAELGVVAYRLRGHGAATDAQDAPATDAPAAALLARLARAAAVPEQRLLEHPRILADAARMGADPRARRALWRQLRALRRGV